MQWRIDELLLGKSNNGEMSLVEVSKANRVRQRQVSEQEQAGPTRVVVLLGLRKDATLLLPPA